MQEYVLTFVFNQTMDKVLLIRKKRPDWQKDQLNGIGGKVEEGELPRTAAKRELLEEAGCNVDEENFILSETIKYDDAIMFIYYTTISPMYFTSKTDEIVSIYHIEDILNGEFNTVEHVPQAIEYIISTL